MMALVTSDRFESFAEFLREPDSVRHRLRRVP
jgi:hypothetical protein